MPLAFTEKQKFTQWWVWALLGVAVLVPLYGLYTQGFLNETFGNEPLPTWALGLLLLGMVLPAVLIYVIELRTTIDDTGIHVNFFPFTKRAIPWNDIAEAEVLNYGFVGGWGIRFGTRYGTVYNTRGDVGVAPRLKPGKKLCIGTQKEEELRAVLAEARRLRKL